MQSQCISCGVEYEVNGTFRGSTVKCPQCGVKISFPKDFREYKVLSQKMMCGGGTFDPERIERLLNKMSLQGWRVVGCSTCNIGEFSVAGHRNEAMIILEKSGEVPRDVGGPL